MFSKLRCIILFHKISCHFHLLQTIKGNLIHLNTLLTTLVSDVKRNNKTALVKKNYY